MLTGKCKDYFKKWYTDKWWNCEYYGAMSEAHGLYKSSFFNDLPFSMQYGVYVDFFDSCNISIKCGDVTFEIYMPDEHLEGIAQDRNEARQKAIEKACEIYNAK